MKIKMLNMDTINKIAAGEVIIRPVSVIKELVENAIDAGATRITVDIEAGGKNKMIVRDNGCGIAYHEVPLAFKRHATSKLTSIDDLETIESLGFRGEALSSVSAVARVQVTTCNDSEEVGSITLFEGGTLVDQRVCSYSHGTEMKVWDLFYNTPARRKHLEKDKKEEDLIRDLLEKLALSNPKVAFHVISNGRSVLNTPGSGNFSDVISTLYGEKVASQLIPIQFENSPMKLTGFIGELTTMRSHREDQIFFINGRYVKNSHLSQALDSAYEGYTMKHQHPFGIVFIELPGRMLDVNIHPAKTEIKILNESLVMLLFKQGIRETLRDANLVVDIGGWENQKSKVKNVPSEHNNEPKELPKGISNPDRFDLEKNQTLNNLKVNKDNSEGQNFSQTTLFEEKGLEKIAENPGAFRIKDKVSSPQIKAARPDFTKMKIIGQLFNTYILLEGLKEIYLIDQHAAHEAFLTRELEDVFDCGAVIPSQGLMAPITLKIRPKDIEKILNTLETYKKLGYDCDVFGEDSLIIRSVPVFLGEPQSSDLLKNLINEDLSEIEAVHQEGQWLYSSKIKDKIILMACKAAVKGGQTLTNQEMHGLLEGLMRLDNPFTCPHGRPIITRLREYELMKLFKRVV
ncbi:MAG: DNA mismatch repair endonuclease MutL [Eubacteriaceae bacterium]|nr:DNA mismatch repair endonuclease MutL [Eubacteriaceae bacterium]